MERAKQRISMILVAAFFALSALFFGAFTSVKTFADEAGGSSESALNERLIVKYSMDDTSTVANAKLAAQKWDSGSQAFVRDTNADATIVTRYTDRWNQTTTGTVSHTTGIEGTGALQFTKNAHARAKFKLPSDATGMTVTMLVKNINSYWSSLIEFWDESHSGGGRFGKGTMQGNGGRLNENDAWSSNCPAHDSASIAQGGGWDSFCINVNSSDNGGAAVDPMKADTWYQVTYVVTATEVRAYRDGALKQTFNNTTAASIASSILTAVKRDDGMLGIRLSLDANDGDILDDLRIYSGVLSEDEIKATVHPLISAAPEYYDVEGLGYPQEILIDGATSVTNQGGVMSGTTSKGITYTYTPLTHGINDTTLENDRKGIQIALSYNGETQNVTVKFRRRLKIEAESLGYKIGSGASVPLEVPQDPGEDIIVKVAAGTSLFSVTAGDIAVKKLEESSNASNYQWKFLYHAASRTATVNCFYVGYESFNTIYTIKFVEKNTETFTRVDVTGGKSDVSLTKADFTGNSAQIVVDDLENFTLSVSVALAEGAKIDGQDGNTVTFTKNDLQSGKLSFTVVNENGEPTVYNLVPVVHSSDATVSAITAGTYTLQKGSGNEYTVTIDKGEGAQLLAAIEVTLTNQNATVKKAYITTENIITVTVTAEDGVTTQTYIIRITELDTDTNLSDILIGGEHIEGFDPATTAYTVKYKGDIPAITAVTTSTQNAAVGTIDAENKVKITVTAENGDTKEYFITFVLMSNDASLTKLTLGGTEITFENNAASYTAPAGTRIKNISVACEVAQGASASYTVNESESKIIVTVTAEDGTTATYTVAVTVQAATLPDSNGGETEDNTPELSGGCNSSVSGAAIALAAFALAGGVCLFVKKSRKTR